MKNRKLSVLSIVTVCLSSMTLLLTGEVYGDKPPSISSLPMGVESIEESDSIFSVHAEYPQFATADPDFNQKIASLISGKIDGFKRESLDNWKARLDTIAADKPVPNNPEQPFDFIASWRDAQLNNRYLSLLIETYYFSGGSHGNEEAHAFNYDVVKKKKISIENFFDSPQEALKKVSTISVQVITSQLQSMQWKVDNNMKEMLKQGTEPTFDNFQNFNFDSHNLIQHFQKYQVTPGTFGSLTVTIPRQILAQNSIQSSYLE